MADQMTPIKVIGFETKYQPDPKSPRDKSKMRAIDYVTYAPISAIMTSQNVERVDFLRPDKVDPTKDLQGKKKQFMEYRWSFIEPAYKAWKNGQTIPVNGTPLGAWNQLTKEQAKVLTSHGFQTVEEIAEMGDPAARKLNLPGAALLPKQARTFLETTDRAAAAQTIESLKAQMAEQKEQLDAAMALLKELGEKKGGKAATEKDAA